MKQNCRRWTVYAICFPNGKLYVGKTMSTAARRFRGHVSDTQHGSAYIVHKALRKYSSESIRLVTLRSGLTDDEAKELEKFYIAEWGLTSDNNGYNMTAGGDGCAGRVPSAKTRQKIADANRRRYRDPEQRRKTGEALAGRRLTGEHLAKTRANAAKGIEIRRGKPLSTEHRQKIGEAQRGKRLSHETRQKMANARRGKKHSRETRCKMSESQLRRGRAARSAKGN